MAGINLKGDGITVIVLFGSRIKLIGAMKHPTIMKIIHAGCERVA